MTSITPIPLNRLVASAHNARRTDRKADIDALAASIQAHGLLQNLTVATAPNERFQVVAGARRHAALKTLAKSGAIARDFAVPCHLVDEIDASETSLVENIQRVAMNAMDEVDAFAALTEAGLTGDEIARRFGCTLRHVEQRMALAALSPKIKAGYRRAEITLDAARAFCIEQDHAKQDAVYRGMGKPITHAASVRANLMQGRMKASDRLARFVGLEAYESAGGALARDLFDADAVFVNDPALMARLADERLNSMREDLLAAGWGWVNINLGNGQFSGGAQRIHPKRREMTAEERKAKEDIDARIDALDEEMEDADSEDPRWEERDQLAACQHSVIDATLEWDRDLIAHAGVVISIDYEGRPSLAFGLVTKADQGKVNRILASRSETLPNQADADFPEDAGTPPEERPSWDDQPGPKLSKSLVSELTAARARALRLRISENPNLSLAIAVFALVRRSFGGGPVAGLGIDLRATTMADHETLEQARAVLSEILPDEPEPLLDWLLQQPQRTLLEILAVIVASALDLANEGVSLDDRRKQAFADRLASVVDLDMTHFWQPDLAFWTRLPKALLLDALAGAPLVSNLPEAERATLLRAHGKLKRDDLANAVAQALNDAKWLPDLLVTPIPAGAFSVTGEGEQAVAAIAAQ